MCTADRHTSPVPFAKLVNAPYGGVRLEDIILIWGNTSRTDHHDNNDGGVQAHRRQANEIDERPQAAPPGIPYDIHLFGWNINNENMRSEASEYWKVYSHKYEYIKILEDV
jgi:hypothetical protein